MVKNLILCNIDKISSLMIGGVEFPRIYNEKIRISWQVN